MGSIPTLSQSDTRRESPREKERLEGLFPRAAAFISMTVREPWVFLEGTPAGDHILDEHQNHGGNGGRNDAVELIVAVDPVGHETSNKRTD